MREQLSWPKVGRKPARACHRHAAAHAGMMCPCKQPHVPMLPPPRSPPRWRRPCQCCASGPPGRWSCRLGAGGRVGGRLGWCDMTNQLAGEPDARSMQSFKPASPSDWSHHCIAPARLQRTRRRRHVHHLLALLGRQRHAGQEGRGALQGMQWTTGDVNSRRTTSTCNSFSTAQLAQALLCHERHDTSPPLRPCTAGPTCSM